MRSEMFYGMDLPLFICKEFTDAEYQRLVSFALPLPVVNAVDSFIKGLSAGAVAAALLATIQASFVSVVEEYSSQPLSAPWHACRWFLYGAMLCNIGAAVGSIMSVIMMNSLTAQCRTKIMTDPKSLPARLFFSSATERIPLEYMHEGCELDLMRAFGLSSSANGMLKWSVNLFGLGLFLSVVQIAIWVWLREQTKVAAPLMLFVLAALVPIYYQQRNALIMGIKIGKLAAEKDDLTLP